MSFKDTKTKVFLGGAVLEAGDSAGAYERAAKLLNRSGYAGPIEIVGFHMPNIPEGKLPSKPNRNRLLTHEELARELGEQVQFKVEGGKLVEVKEN